MDRRGWKTQGSASKFRSSSSEAPTMNILGFRDENVPFSLGVSWIDIWKMNYGDLGEIVICDYFSLSIEIDVCILWAMAPNTSSTIDSEIMRTRRTQGCPASKRVQLAHTRAGRWPVRLRGYCFEKVPGSN
jgi:hypothetical protein